MKKLKTVDIVKTVTDICKKLDELDVYIDSLPTLHSEMDMRMSDLYHPIENEELTVKQAKRFTDEIQSVCNNRRIIKTDTAIAKVFRDNQGKLLQKDNRQLLLSRLNSLAKMKENTDYYYRVYTEGEINKLLGIRKTNTKKGVTKNVEEEEKSTEDM